MPSPQLGTPPVVEAQLVHPNLLGPAKPEHPTAVALAAPAAPTAWPVPGPAAALSAMTFGSPTQPSDAGVPPFATNASLAAGMCFAPATSAMAASNAGPQQQHPALAMPTPVVATAATHPAALLAGPPAAGTSPQPQLQLQAQTPSQQAQQLLLQQHLQHLHLQQQQALHQMLRAASLPAATGDRAGQCDCTFYMA